MLKRLLGAAVGALLAVGLIGSPALAGGPGRGEGHTPVTFCHKPGSPAQQELTSDDDGFVQGHLGHGDTLGACPPATPPFKPYQTGANWLLPSGYSSDQKPSPGPEIYPQTRTTLTTPPCGFWMQKDVYWIESLDEEKIYLSLGDTLTYGEDSKIYKSHVFVYGGPCKPDQPAPYDTYEWDIAGTPECGQSVVTQTGAVIHHTYEWNASLWTWVETTTTESTSREIEVAVTPCPTETPTPTPTATPTVTPTPVATTAVPMQTPAAVVPAAETGKVTELAATGGNGWGAALAAALVGLGVSAVLLRRRLQSR